MRSIFTEEERHELQEAVAWKRQTITIPLHDGGERKMKASVLGAWAVHKGLSFGWSITHALSGALLVSRLGTMKQAKAGVAKMVKTTPDLLNLKRSEVDTRYAELRGWVKKIERGA